MVQNIQMYKAKLIDEKLMLTSTDIQVGDKVKCFNYPEQPEREVVNLRTSKKLVGTKDHSEIYHLVDIQYPNEVNTSAVTGFFKVIGEISPDATWVKEGDEIEEYEAEMFYKTKNGWKLLDTFIELAEKKYFITVKGPCGHFH